VKKGNGLPSGYKLTVAGEYVETNIFFTGAAKQQDADVIRYSRIGVVMT
jgi:hypothetical protein